jgi:hypothetical protein
MVKSQHLTIGHLTTNAKALTLDIPSLVDTRLLIQANSGGGKSYLLRLIAERAAGKIQMLILDPEGEFATLREKVDIALVGNGGEMPTDIRAAELLARKLVEMRVSAIVDLAELKLPDRRRFVRLFLESLMNSPRALWHPMLVVLDECHLFCPERSAGEAESTNAVIALMSQGRKRGFAGILATQRLSKLHKDAAAESNNVVIGRTWLDVDQQRAGDLLGMNKTDRQALRDLDPGTFFAFGPALSGAGVVRFHADTVETTHPKAGERHLMEVPPASAAIQEIVKQIGDLPAQAEEETRTLDNLQRENADLKRQLRARPIQIEQKLETKIEEVKVPIFREGELETLAAVSQTLTTGVPVLGDIVTEIRRALDQAQRLREAPAPRRPMPASAVPAKRISPISDPMPGPASHSPLRGGERLIMIAAAQYPDGVTREQLTVLTGYKRSSRDTYLQRLAQRGLVEIERDRILATDSGIAILGNDYQPLPTGVELIEYWQRRLSGGERAIFDVLVREYPNEVSRDSLSESIGYRRSSRDTYIQRLQARQLLTSRRNAVRASDHLFGR